VKLVCVVMLIPSKEPRFNNQDTWTNQTPTTCMLNCCNRLSTLLGRIPTITVNIHHANYAKEGWKGGRGIFPQQNQGVCDK
jgi:hypothetical protein